VHNKSDGARDRQRKRRVLERDAERPGMAMAVIATFAVGMASDLAIATEGGGSQKALGVDTVMAGVMPPPGDRLTTFLVYYDATHTLDGSGNDRAGVSNFKLQAEAAVLRVQHVWETELLGANVETRVGLSAYVHAHVRFDVRTPSGLVHRDSSASGVGDGLIGPIILGWHSERFHQSFGPELFVPVGKFDKTHLANASRNYYSLGLQYWFTWYPTDDIEVSGTPCYLFNAKNRDTDYKSGDELTFDYAVGYEATPAWQIGVNGNVYKQLTDDRQNGQVVPGGNRGQAVAIGPFVRYHPSPDWGVTLKWQHESWVENRTPGDRIFLQFALKLW
jgi:hypothetical protein